MYSQEMADKHINFIRLLRHTLGRWQGTRFCMLDWQEQLLRHVFGEVDENDKRIVRQVYLEIAKKNGKSELGAAIALDLLINDGEPGAEIYSAASEKEQAGIIFRVAAQMVRQDPALEKRLRVIDSTKRIIDYKTDSFYKVISAEAYSKHGYNIHGLLFDELHTQPNRELFDTLTEGAGDAREQPLFFFMTTAGYDKLSVCYEQHEYGKRILSGELEDKSFYPVIFAMDEEDDWEDEKNWPKANPSLGHIFDIDKLRAGYQKAKEIPAKENTFRRLRLNQWTEQETRWMNIGLWKACRKKVEWKHFEGEQCYVGMDLASKDDIAAAVLAFPTDDFVYLKPYFWIPGDNIQDRVKKHRVPYDAWVKKGWVKATEGDTIDEDFILTDIMELLAIYKVEEIAYDPWHAQHVVATLQKNNVTMVPIAQVMSGMGPPTQTFETLIKGKKVVHDGNPVLAWMFGNVSMREDSNGSYRPDKKKSREKVDGIVAAVMAIDRYSRHTAKAKSVYETRGFVKL